MVRTKQKSVESSIEFKLQVRHCYKFVQQEFTICPSEKKIIHSDDRNFVFVLLPLPIFVVHSNKHKDLSQNPPTTKSFNSLERFPLI